MTEPRVIRQSMLSSWEVCPRRLQYDVDPNIPRGDSQVASEGSAYHAALELYYLERKQTGFFVPSAGQILQYVTEARRYLDERDQAGMVWETSKEQALLRVDALIEKYFVEARYWGPEWEIVDVEWWFSTPFKNGWEASGTVDLVLKRGDHYKLVDHKTSGKGWPKGKEAARKNVQAAWYLYWFSKLNNIHLDDVSFSFDIITEKKFERRDTYRTQAEILAVLSKAELITTVLDVGIELPPNTTTPLCDKRYCNYWDICPFGAGMDRTGTILTLVPGSTQNLVHETRFVPVLNKGQLMYLSSKDISIIAQSSSHDVAEIVAQALGRSIGGYEVKVLGEMFTDLHQHVFENTLAMIRRACEEADAPEEEVSSGVTTADITSAPVQADPVEIPAHVLERRRAEEANAPDTTQPVETSESQEVQVEHCGACGDPVDDQDQIDLSVYYLGKVACHGCYPALRKAKK